MMLLDVWILVFKYVTSTWQPVAVLLFLLLAAVLLVGWRVYLLFRKEVGDCNLQRENLQKRVAELEADVRVKDEVIKELKEDIEKLEANTQHLQELLNSLLEKMVDEKANKKASRKNKDAK